MKLEISTEDLRKILREGIVEFQFEKKDGTLREAKGTLKPTYIPEDQKPKNESEDEKSPYGNNLRYWDLDKEAWRALSASIETVKLL